jgi:hypothetical protein
MELGDKSIKFDLEEVLRWCLKIQCERILRGLLCETASQKLSPDIHRELLTFAKIAQLIAFNSKPASPQPVGPGPSAGPLSQTEVRKEIRDLDSEDRHLLRAALEQMISSLGRTKNNKEDQESIDLQEPIDEEKNKYVEEESH